MYRFRQGIISASYLTLPISRKRWGSLRLFWFLWVVCLISLLLLCIENPTPLPKRRERALTPLPPTRYPLRSQVLPQVDQSQSALLSELPLEVRLAIWEAAIGGRHLHILHMYRQLGHIVCRDPQLCTVCRADYRHIEPLARPQDASDWSLLSLLKTCRQMYCSLSIFWGFTSLFS